MKRLVVLSACLLCATLVNAQNFARVDRSVLDVAYLPHNFAHDRSEGEKAVAKVVYSRPLKNDRIIFGGLVPYGKVWRTGANESTEIKFYQDVKFGGEPVKAGTYSMFSIPGEDKWTIILNSDLDYWGHFSYKEENDVLRVEAAVRKIEEPQEAFTIQFTRKGESPAKMMLAWDTTVVEVPVEY